MSVEFLDLGGNLSKIAQERATSERKVEAPNIRQKFMELLERELNISQNDIDFSKSLKRYYRLVTENYEYKIYDKREI